MTSLRSYAFCFICISATLFSQVASSHNLSPDKFFWGHNIELKDDKGEFINIKFTNKDEFVQDGKLTAVVQKFVGEQGTVKQPKQMCFQLDAIPRVNYDHGELLFDEGEIGPVIALAYVLYFFNNQAMAVQPENQLRGMFISKSVIQLYPAPRIGFSIATDSPLEAGSSFQAENPLLLVSVESQSGEISLDFEAADTEAGKITFRVFVGTDQGKPAKTYVLENPAEQPLPFMTDKLLSGGYFAAPEDHPYTFDKLGTPPPSGTSENENVLAGQQQEAGRKYDTVCDPDANDDPAAVIEVGISTSPEGRRGQSPSQEPPASPVPTDSVGRNGRGRYNPFTCCIKPAVND